MATPPTFTAGQILTAAQMNTIGLWRNTSCTVTSTGGTAATASNGIITVGSANTSLIIGSAFSADYENYLIIASGIQFSSANDSVTLQLRTGSSTSATGYYYVLGYWSYAGVAGVSATSNGTSFNNIGRGLGATEKNSFNINIDAPFLTQKTTIGAFVTGSDLTGVGSGYHNSATSYDQCVIATTAGNMTGGTIRVYGYRL